MHLVCFSVVQGAKPLANHGIQTTAWRVKPRPSRKKVPEVGTEQLRATKLTGWTATLGYWPPCLPIGALKYAWT